MYDRPGHKQTGEPCGSPTKARPLKYRRAEVVARPAWAGVRFMPQAVKPGRWVFPDDLVIIREWAYLGFSLAVKWWDWLKG
ncbi:protein of unknown function [Paraburkholderia dioscoreae]|uniref:Uncharacterized protein n=1 Tax=Paraburkholderia dioscoreae TaxID=2604047 RepID=A0A5Q4Z867_9BURK|nr:protein of unknown function [Paraburkholderia dioscoreae]